MTDIFDQLSAPFPPSEIEWRVGSTNADKTSGLALAYLTARHVMERLDDVVGPTNWQDRYEFSGTKTICYLSVRVGGEWITKADGAGDSDVEAEKGAISDALKRAAVKIGIGRYLYALGNTWVDVEAAGKSVRIKKDQYGKLESILRNRFGDADRSPVQTVLEPLATQTAQLYLKVIRDELFGCTTLKQLENAWERHARVVSLMVPTFQSELTEFKEGLGKQLREAEPMLAVTDSTKLVAIDNATDTITLQARFREAWSDTKDEVIRATYKQRYEARKAFLEGAELAKAEKAAALVRTL